MQGSSQMPLSLSSTKATRKNEATLSIDDNLSNNNGNSEKETNKTVSIKENQDNGNFSIDIEEILNYEPASNTHSLNDTIIVSSENKQNIKSDIISITFYDKITHIKVNNKSERCVINLSSHVLTKLEIAVLEKRTQVLPYTKPTRYQSNSG